MKTCFLDMDGVIADWIKAMSLAHNRMNPYNLVTMRGKRLLSEHWGMERHVFWKPCTIPQFWRDIPKMPDADAIVSEIRRYYDDSQIVILSTPNYEAAAMDGKIRWLQRHYPEFLGNYFFGKNKSALAHPDALLIDDCQKNARLFSERGGNSILLPRPWNGLHMVDPLDSLRRHLRKLAKYG